MSRAYEDYLRWLEALHARRAPAETAAAALIEAGSYDEGERTVLAVDNSIYGHVAIARLYRARLQTLVASGTAASDPGLARTIFQRALTWSWRSYPEPHTACEAEQYDEGQARDRAELVAILGYDPVGEEAS